MIMGRARFTKGVITGAIIGSTVSMIMNPMGRRDRRILKRKARNIVKGISDSFDGIRNMKW